MKSTEQLFTLAYELITQEERQAQLRDQINRKRGMTILGAIMIFNSVIIDIPLISFISFGILEIHLIISLILLLITNATLIAGFVLLYKGFSRNLHENLENRQTKISEIKIKILRLKHENDLISSQI